MFSTRVQMKRKPSETAPFCHAIRRPNQYRSMRQGSRHPSGWSPVRGGVSALSKRKGSSMQKVL